MNLEDKILMTNLIATENFLSKQGQGSYAYYIRQALDKLYPEWRDKEYIRQALDKLYPEWRDKEQ